jgi:hypothetical protein
MEGQEFGFMKDPIYLPHPPFYCASEPVNRSYSDRICATMSAQD